MIGQDGPEHQKIKIAGMVGKIDAAGVVVRRGTEPARLHPGKKTDERGEQRGNHEAVSNLSARCWIRRKQVTNVPIVIMTSIQKRDSRDQLAICSPAARKQPTVSRNILCCLATGPQKSCAAPRRAPSARMYAVPTARTEALQPSATPQAACCEA